jgi:iron complex transport system substrate-binding protein
MAVKYMRICSFLPSATEIVYLLGLGDSLYGVSHECDYPPGASEKPKVVRSRIDSSSMTSQEIDAAVTGMMMRGENIYSVDEDALADGRPDLVVTQQLCEVCAVSFEDVQEAVGRLEVSPTVLSLDPHGVGDVLQDILRVGQHTGTQSVAHVAVFNLRARIDMIRRAVASSEARPRVACIEWMDPVIAAGHWVPELVQIAGGIDVLVEPGAPSPRLDFDLLAEANPEVVVLMPCGMDVEKAKAEFDALPNRSQWENLTAFRNGRAYVVDSGALFSRSGPRLVDGLEVLAWILQPELFRDQPSADICLRL